jgi:ketopantoate hydroxymethyltransferase
MAKVFGNAGEVILNGLKQYVKEVSEKSFPQPENWFTITDDEYQDLLGML